MWDIIKNEVLVYKKFTKQQKNDYNAKSEEMYKYMISAAHKMFESISEDHQDSINYFVYLTDELISVCAAGTVFIDGGLPILSIGRTTICKIINIVYEYKIKDIESNEHSPENLVESLTSISNYMENELKKINEPFAEEAEETLTWMRVASKYYSRGYDNIEEQLCEGSS